MSKANQEVLSTMLHIIDSFKSGRYPLYRLVNDLKAGLYGLVEVSSSWIDAFQEDWFILEEVNSAGLARHDTDISEESREAVLAAANRLQSLVAAAEREISAKNVGDAE